MKKDYLLISIFLLASCQKQTETYETSNMGDTLTSVINNHDSLSIKRADSIVAVSHVEPEIPKTKYVVIWAIIAPREDSELVSDSIHRYQSIGSEVIEITNYSEDAKYREMDKFEKMLYDDGAVPQGMDIKKRNILVYDTYAEASKKREEFIK